MLDPADAAVDLLYVMVGIDLDESRFFRKSLRISPNHVTKIEPMPELRTS